MAISDDKTESELDDSFLVRAKRTRVIRGALLSSGDQIKCSKRRQDLSMLLPVDWNNVNILDCDNFYPKRLISEILCIKTQRNRLNLQTDTKSLDQSYADILHKLINNNVT
ncbi:hypothetical protein ALC57_09607 [Trachymyrmex cornetzi]|uniref:Uncharacterized protein n=1 Tax=Trachymyrmex cornetzi TaxID=471704 RepID=A0A195DZP8_9HYME|nr:hypothetical protein ALC57_09607 [Trachymyrmex cornetzi]